MPVAVGKITKRTVDALKPGQQLFDQTVRGFMVRAYSTRKVYALKYVAGGRQTIYTIGDHGGRTPDKQSMTPERAKKVAESLRGRIAMGQDPQAEKAATEGGKRTAPTIAHLLDRYLSEHVETHNKPSTAKEVKRVVESVLKPEFGKLKLAELKRARIKEWHAGLKATPYEANRALAYLQKMLALASTDWELRSDNPCLGIKRFPEKKRERFFSEAELQKIGAAVATLEAIPQVAEGSVHPSAVALLRFMALTGLRLTEARVLRWSEVDLGTQVLHIEDGKGGSKSVPLGAPAAALLSAQKRQGPHVFPGLTAEGAMPERFLRKLWERVREISKVPNARPHDLRHTLGTYTAQTGANAFVVRDLLGHKTMAMTGRYVERAVDPLRATAEATSHRISAAMAGQAAKVVTIETARTTQRARGGRGT